MIDPEKYPILAECQSLLGEEDFRVFIRVIERMDSEERRVFDIFMLKVVSAARLLRVAPTPKPEEGE